MRRVYLERYAYRSLELSLPVHPDTGLFIVIPAYKEPDLLSTLDSLSQSAVSVNFHVEVICIINFPEDAPQALVESHEATLKMVERFQASHIHQNISFLPALVPLTKKHAGVGLARKAGMDEAIRRVHKIGKYEIPIVCLDADCTVSENYLQAIYEFFIHNQHIHAASIFFEHPIANGIEDKGIVMYELYLRYYINALQFCGYPLATQTIGSAMAVRADWYEKHGGMNRRKAGEDFYFIHKLLPHGHYGHITNAVVYPSGRTSDRVPFGTGAAIGQWQNGTKALETCYDFEVFRWIRDFMFNVDKALMNQETAFPVQIAQYLSEIGYIEVLGRIISEAKDFKQRRKKFFMWFDGLQMLHLVHYLRDNYLLDSNLHENVNSLFQEYLSIKRVDNMKDQLEILRQHDRINTTQIGL